MSNNRPSYEKINYSLRPAKNIERKMMAEVIGCLERFRPLRNYQYVGFGSIFFADFRLFHRSLGMNEMVSIECNERDKDRVDFNRPYHCVDVRMGMSYDVLPHLDWKQRTIAWLDYDHELAHHVLLDVDLICSRIQSGSVLAVTLDGESKRLKNPKTVRKEDRGDWPKKRIQQFERLVGQAHVSPELKRQRLQGSALMETYRELLTNQIEETLRTINLGATDEEKWLFQQIFNFRYADGAQIMTIGWVLFQSRDADSIDKCGFESSAFFRNGAKPVQISVPNLTFREMRSLDRHLPKVSNQKEYDAIPVPEEDKERYRALYRFFPAFSETDL